MPSATPAQRQPRLVRRGDDRILVSRVGEYAGAPLPPFCVKCGAPSTAPLEKTFRYSPIRAHGSNGVLALISLLLYFATLKRLDLVVPFCAAHRARRTRMLIAGWATLAASLLLPVPLILLTYSPGLGLVALVALLIPAVIILVRSASLRTVEIDDEEGVFKGVSQEFLRRVEPD